MTYRRHGSIRWISFLLIVLICACRQPAEKTQCVDRGPPLSPSSDREGNRLVLNPAGYLEKRGLNVMAFDDFYPEGHQGGVSIVHHGERVAANGDLRLEAAPGQWQPVPRLKERRVDRKRGEIVADLVYPDESKNRRGFNPIEYPDLVFSYTVRVRPDHDGFRVRVDLDAPLPETWAGRVGFNLELFPGAYFGKSFNMDGAVGIFPRQVNGPVQTDPDGHFLSRPLARGKRLSIASEDAARRMHFEALSGDLVLLDGRSEHNNGWFVLRSVAPAGKTDGAIEWRVVPDTLPGWLETPVVHVSQVGYHPKQKKVAVIELDKHDVAGGEASLVRVAAGGEHVGVKTGKPAEWGTFLRYRYLTFDFSGVREAGVYRLTYGDVTSNLFVIGEDVFARHVWQPTLEYYLPVQMCHMRVNDRYRVWHGRCHMDDALMAPTDTNHFDGYAQGPSTLTEYRPGEPVPGLNVGGWHDAGDYDLRVESQMRTVKRLAEIHESFGVAHDETTIDQKKRIVELHRPDGKPDVLQQLEHGVLSVVGGYRHLGRLYRGIICPTHRQYVLLGDASTMTDNRVGTGADDSGAPDDRLVFTEENPARELLAAGGLAAASRALREYNPELSGECLEIARKIYASLLEAPGKKVASERVGAAVELLLATGSPEYREALVAMLPVIISDFENVGWMVAQVAHRLDDPDVSRQLSDAARLYAETLDEQGRETPFGMPYTPGIWGAGWGIQAFGVRHFFLQKAWPAIFGRKQMLDALNFVLGVHPGKNTASFVSGVGVASLTVAYGANRADWSYIPGGVGSGTALIRPDLAELKEWPFFWQQSEYVMGGGGTNFMFLALAANHVLND